MELLLNYLYLINYHSIIIPQTVHMNSSVGIIYLFHNVSDAGGIHI